MGDYIAGRTSCWTDYVGAAFGGGVGGLGLLYGGPVAAGAAGGFSGNALTQALNDAWGYQTGADVRALAFNTGMGAFLGKFGSLSYQGVTTGRNSYNAIFKQMRTKLRNGTASGLRPQTAAKMFAGRAADAGLFPSSIVDSAIDQVDNAASMNGRGCGCR